MIRHGVIGLGARTARALRSARAPRRDLALAGLLTSLLLATTAWGTAHWHAHRPVGIAGYLLVFAAGAALAWRRAAPNAVLLWGFGCTMAFGALGYPSGPMYLALIIAFVTAVLHGDRRVAYAVLAAGYPISAYLVPGVTGERIGSLTSQAALAGWLLLLAAIAELSRVAGQARRAEAERAVRAEEARLEQARRRAGEERLLMAQDLHDVLAHQLALITVQANAGLAMLHRQPERAGESLLAIKQAGNSALAGLRGVLDALRTDGTAPRRPIPLLSRAADLQALADGARAAGLTVLAGEAAGPGTPLPAAADAAAYRVVQEALTNAVRHAGPGSTVTVRVDRAGDMLTIAVTDDGRGTPAPASAGGGAGLPGMAERVRALGGILQAGPRPGGGFAVTAQIPLGDRR
jgi:signal transduction histidine kinase